MTTMNRHAGGANRQVCRCKGKSMPGQKFSEWVKAEMERQGLSMAALSRESGISRPTISAGMTGNRWTWDSVREISRALGRSLASRGDAAAFVIDWAPDHRVKKVEPTLMQVLTQVRNCCAEFGFAAAKPAMAAAGW